MVTLTSTVDTGHEDMVHDAQMDYYGTRLATCSSDKFIKIFSVQGQQLQQQQVLSGHEGAVWQVSWSHPQFGPVLASCSYDKKVIIWQETDSGKWEKSYEYTDHTSSVNSICWAPHEHGLHLATASSDQTIAVLSYQADGKWTNTKISEAHLGGCYSVSWAPAIPAGALSDSESALSVRKLVSGGADKLVKIWNFNETESKWQLEDSLEAHEDWIRDVAWAPSIGLPRSLIASCAQDGRVYLWTREGNAGSWRHHLLHKFPDVVWHVSWSLLGSVLAVSHSDNKVSLWKQQHADGAWRQISDVNSGAAVAPGS